VALCVSREQAEEVKARLAGWLAPRGLAFNEDKTRVVHLDEGFDFLGGVHPRMVSSPTHGNDNRAGSCITTRRVRSVRSRRVRGHLIVQQTPASLIAHEPGLNGGVLCRSARAGVLHWRTMTVNVDLPDELLDALRAEATRRGVSVDELIAEWISDRLEPRGRHRFGFIGLGRSGDGELSTRYKDYRRAAIAGRTAADA
jgi:hypothetical protein